MADATDWPEVWCVTWQIEGEGGFAHEVYQTRAEAVDKVARVRAHARETKRKLQIAPSIARHR